MYICIYMYIYIYINVKDRDSNNGITNGIYDCWNPPPGASILSDWGAEEERQARLNQETSTRISGTSCFGEPRASFLLRTRPMGWIPTIIFLVLMVSIKRWHSLGFRFRV